jgi:DNA uptake protein ComE-like DNA-binding protein
MEKEVERELLLEYLNSVETPEEIADRFQSNNDQLIDLPLAQQILAARETYPDKRFATLAQLTAIPGIDQNFLAGIVLELSNVFNWAKDDRPALLLPLRLETRFKENELWLRIYPDQVSIHTHDPLLTQTEVDAGVAYFETLARSTEDERRSAWRQLSKLFGPARAAWIVKTFEEHDTVEQIEVKDEEQEGWFVVPKLMGLPDRFMVFGYQSLQDNSERLVCQVPGRLIRGDLAMLGDPSSGLELFDSESRWVMDFSEAENRGMGIRITGEYMAEGTDLLNGFSRLIVVGIRLTEAQTGQQILEQCIENHHFSTGFGFLEYGTPTNNTEHVSSGHSERVEDHEGSYDIEVVGHPNWEDAPDEPRSNAERLGYALGLGLRPEVLRKTDLAASTTDIQVKDMQTALWPATGDYLLRYMLPGVMAPEHMVQLGEYYTKYVRANGPLPGIRIGDQPYGILPVSRVEPYTYKNSGWSPSWDDSPGSEDWEKFDEQSYLILKTLYDKWLEWARDRQRVPRIDADNPTQDPDGELLKILAMEPTSVAYRLRPFVDERFVAWMLSALRDYIFGPDTPYSSVDSSPVRWMKKWSTNWLQLRQDQAQFWNSITGVLTDAFADAPLLKTLGWWNDRDLERDLVSHVPTGDAAGNGEPSEVPAEYLNDLCQGNDIQTPPLTLLRELLERALDLAADSSFGDESVVRNAICNMAMQSPTELDWQFRQALDLCSHRLDAWITSLATRRLEAMRDRRPTGISIGAYGWVENLQVRSGARSEGYIHAPSSAHAKAAAVLHNAYQTYTDEDNPNAFRINLSSDRVRRGMRIIEGVRQGQPLGALLGFQFERGLHESKHDHYIDLFRHSFPVVANKQTTPNQGDSVETIAARNVVDGLALAKWWQDDDRDEIPELLPALNERVIDDELNRLISSLDAMSDILMSEGVYQAVQGNFERGGAALEAASGNACPPEIESVHTPVTGKNLEHRVCLVFPSQANAMTGIRPSAEPRLAAWFADLLGGDLTRIGCRYTIGKVNINEAVMEELARLPGLGTGRAESIVEFREQNAKPFESLDQLVDTGLDIDSIESLRPWVMTGFEEVTQERFYQPLNINTANRDQIVTRLNVEPSVAEAIIAARPYGRINELISVLDRGSVDAIRPFVSTNDCTQSVEDLGIDAIDLLYLSATPPVGEETEIEQRVAYRVRAKHGLAHDSRIEIDFSRSHGFAYAMAEAIELGRQILDTLGTGSVLQPGSMCLPSEADGALFTSGDVEELQLRASAVRSKVISIIGELDKQIGDDTTADSRTPEQIIAALFEASQCGVNGAIAPAPIDPDLDRRRRDALAELEKRDKAYQTHLLQAFPIDPSVTSPPPDRQISLLIEAISDLLGSDFVVLPTFVPINENELTDAFSQLDLLNGQGEERVRLWMQQAAYVHSPLSRLEETLILTEGWRQSSATTNESSLTLQVAQLPYDPANRWLAMDDDERGARINHDITSNRGALSIVAAVSGTAPVLAQGERISGLMIHQWAELIPSDTADTSVSFQYDGPNAQAPQCLLLSVPGMRSEVPEAWHEEELAMIVKDTMDLVKVRAVDPDAIHQKIEDDVSEEQGIGLVFPSLMFPTDRENPGWARNAYADSIEDWVNKLIRIQKLAFVMFKEFDPFQNVGSSLLHDESAIAFADVGGGDMMLGAYRLPVKKDWKRVLISTRDGIRIALPNPVPRIDLVAGWMRIAEHEVVVMDESGNPLDFNEQVYSGYTKGIRTSLTGEHVQYNFWTHHITAGGIKYVEVRGLCLLSIISTYREI